MFPPTRTATAVARIITYDPLGGMDELLNATLSEPQSARFEGGELDARSTWLRFAFHVPENAEPFTIANNAVAPPMRVSLFIVPCQRSSETQLDQRVRVFDTTIAEYAFRYVPIEDEEVTKMNPAITGNTGELRVYSSSATKWLHQNGHVKGQHSGQTDSETGKPLAEVAKNNTPHVCVAVKKAVPLDFNGDLLSQTSAHVSDHVLTSLTFELPACMLLMLANTTFSTILQRAQGTDTRHGDGGGEDDDDDDEEEEEEEEETDYDDGDVNGKPPLATPIVDATVHPVFRKTHEYRPERMPASADGMVQYYAQWMQQKTQQCEAEYRDLAVRFDELPLTEEVERRRAQELAYERAKAEKHPPTRVLGHAKRQYFPM